MSKMTYTSTQEKAIKDTLNINVSVSAGAGSGKTRVLVDRFIELVATDKANSDEILAITFTKKAAKEMGERVRRALFTKQEKAVGKDKEKWQRQLEKLGKAQITTIDSFCHKVLRENPVESRMDPNFAVNAEFEIDEFVADLIQDFLSSQVAAENKEVLLLLENYLPSQLSTMLFGLTDNLEEILRETDLSLPYEKNLDAEGELQAAALSAYDALLAVDNLSGAATLTAMDKLKAQKPLFSKMLSAGEYESLAGFGGMLRSSKKIKEPLEDFREALAALKSLALDKKALPIIKAWDKVLRTYQELLSKTADQKELYSFSTIATKAVEVLKTYPEILHRYRGKYKFIMVDEFQDTNQLQKELVYLLAGGRIDKLAGKRLFIVGDAKQSIYRFRGADVSVFKQVRDDIGKTGGENIVMADNFRSSKRIIATCNCLFQDLLTKDGAADVTAQDLTANRELGTKPTIFTIEMEKGEDKTLGDRVEANLAAQTIKDLLAKDKKLNYGDVAVLLPAISLATNFAAAFGQLGIPYTILDGKGFYERQENIDITNLLAFLLNNRKDYCLTGILRSPYFCFTDQVLTDLFKKKGENTLWETVARDQRDCCQKATEKLSRLQQAATGTGLEEIFTAIYAELQVEAVLLGQEFGREKLANVNKLRKLAVDFALQFSGSPRDFLQRFRTLRDVEAREGTAVIQDTDKAVSLMTIHKSKGLEFPVVYLPALQSKGRNDASGIVFRPEIGLGIKVMSEDGSLGETSVYHAAKEENKKLEESEKIRQLYVAMTRAEDYLFLSSVKKITDREGTDAKENWFASLERVFNPEEENGKFVLWKNITPKEVETQVAEKVISKPLVVPRETYERIVSLDIQKQENVFTASALQEYDICPRRYYYNHVEEMPRVDPETKGEQGYKVAPYILGLAVHKALELTGELPLEEAIKKAVAQQDVSPSVEKLLVKQTRSLLTKYCASPLYLQNKDVPMETEKEFFQSLFKVAQEDIYFKGSIDGLFHYKDGNLGIVDYKTGHPPVNGAENIGYERQLLIYTWAAEEIFQQKVVSAQLHFLQNCTVQDLAEDRETAKEELQKLIIEIRSKKNEQDFRALPDNCQYCPYSYFCKKV